MGKTNPTGRERSSEQFLALLEPIRDSLYRYAKHTAWRDDLGEEIVQEAVMTAWREFDRYQPGTNFRAWVFKILVNTSYRLNKRVARKREVPLDDAAGDLSMVLEREEAWSHLLADQAALEQLLDERLVRALRALGEEERHCLLLRLLEDLPYKEIATMLGIPLGTVMSHVHRARIRLREVLAGLAVEYGLIEEAAS